MGNLYAKRDWGHAKDFVRAFWLINNQENPSDFVVATKYCITVKDFLLETFSQAGFPDLKFVGKGIDEKLMSSDRVIVSIDPQFLRPGEVPHLIGDSSKIERELGWQPKYTVSSLLKEMLEYDTKLA